MHVSQSYEKNPFDKILRLAVWILRTKNVILHRLIPFLMFTLETTKVAVPTRDGVVDDHFGHCAYYTIFTILANRITATERMASPEGCGCKSGIAPVLAEKGVRVMLAGNMGQGAKNVLESQRIEVIRGCRGDVEELVAAYLAGNIKDNGESCDHHDCH